MATHAEDWSREKLLMRAGELRSQAERARRLANGFPYNGDRDLLLAQARELDDKERELEQLAAQRG